VYTFCVISVDNMCSVRMYTDVCMQLTHHLLQPFRESIYLKGGVLFITSRIIVMDLLKKTCPVEKIMGILVYRAHKLVYVHATIFGDHVLNTYVNCLTIATLCIYHV